MFVWLKFRLTICSNFFPLSFQTCVLSTLSRHFTAKSPRSYWPPSSSRWFSRSTISGHQQITKHHPPFQVVTSLHSISNGNWSHLNHLQKKLFSLPKLTLPICVHFLDTYLALVILSLQLSQCRQLPSSIVYNDLTVFNWGMLRLHTQQGSFF